jgi:hypothetical protein
VFLQAQKEGAVHRQGAAGAVASRSGQAGKASGQPVAPETSCWPHLVVTSLSPHS